MSELATKLLLLLSQEALLLAEAGETYPQTRHLSFSLVKALSAVSGRSMMDLGMPEGRQGERVWELELSYQGIRFIFLATEHVKPQLAVAS